VQTKIPKRKRRESVSGQGGGSNQISKENSLFKKIKNKIF